MRKAEPKADWLAGVDFTVLSPTRRSGMDFENCDFGERDDSIINPSHCTLILLPDPDHLFNPCTPTSFGIS